MTKVREEKVIAGLSCGDVLDRLSDYLDEELPTADRARVEDHLRGCEGCARFGGEFRATIRALRTHLGARDPLPRSVRQRYRALLDHEGS